MFKVTLSTINQTKLRTINYACSLLPACSLHPPCSLHAPCMLPIRFESSFWIKFEIIQICIARSAIQLQFGQTTWINEWLLNKEANFKILRCFFYLKKISLPKRRVLPWLTEVFYLLLFFIFSFVILFFKSVICFTLRCSTPSIILICRKYNI